MTLIDKFNKRDFNKICLKCENQSITKPDFNTLFDWRCSKCKTSQLEHIKNKGFRYYAFLLSGSCTSKYIFARSVKEAFKRCQKLYKDKSRIYRSYLVGPTTGYVLDGWFSLKGGEIERWNIWKTLAIRGDMKKRI